MPLPGKMLKVLLKTEQKVQGPNLYQFTEKLFQLLKEANPERVEYEVSEDRENLDTLARLLVGDEVCSAVAISGDSLLLATNRNLHLEEQITVTKNVKILSRTHQKLFFENSTFISRKPLEYVLEFSDTLVYKRSDLDLSSKEIKKTSRPVTYKRQAEEQTFLLHAGDPNIEFSQAEHKIHFPGNEDSPICWNMSLKESVPVKDFEFLSNRLLDVEGPFLRPKTVDINPLRRRAKKLMRCLGMIAHSILTKPDLEEAVGAYLEENNEWPTFLHDSLSHEMSTWSSYRDHIKPSDFSDPGMKSMLSFYESLVKDYQDFKSKNHLKTSVISIKSWCEHVGNNIQNIPQVPEFIKNKPIEFLDKGLKYFVDLVRVAKFVEKDSKQKGTLSKVLTQENIISEKTCVRVVDGLREDQQHAEMRLLEKHMSDNSSSDYFGITKLCCGFCTFSMKRFNLANYRGSHGALFGNWVLPETFTKPKLLEKLLGDDLYSLYVKLEQETIHLDNQKKNESTKKSDVALMIFESLASINSIAHLQEVGLDEKYYIPPCSGNMYPSEETSAPVVIEDILSTQLSDLLLNPPPPLKIYNHQHRQALYPLGLI